MLLDRNKLKVDGFITFNLSDIDTILFEELKNKLRKEELEQYITNFRFDGVSDSSIFDSPESLKKIIKDFGFVNFQFDFNAHHGTEFHFRANIQNSNIDKLLEFENIISSKVSSFSQLWFYNNYPKENNDLLHNIFKKTIFELYTEELKNYPFEFGQSQVDLTLFKKNNFIINHRDGFNEGRVCVLLMYLNDDYEVGFGGELKIGDIIIEPKLGNIVILDFVDNNVEHEVTPVLNENFKRFALTRFFHLPEKKVNFI